ncbi:MAG: AraC family transcriptional regulator [Deltaproteobacteria bacterium]
MNFETHAPSGPGADLVEAVFSFSAFVPDHSIERVVPTGDVFLIVELDGLERHTYDNDTLEPDATFRGAWLSGAHHAYLSISAHEDSAMFVVQFKAHGAYPFLHRPMSAFADRVVPGEALEHLELGALRDALVTAADASARFAVADRWLDARYDASLRPPAAFVQVVERLRDAPASKLQDVLATYGASQKHLIDQFKRYVGLTPKSFQRVLRFNDVLAQMKERRTLSWADIAYRCGYADQSHFIREFKKFSGFNPTGFIERGFDEGEPNFFPLDPTPPAPER